MEWRGTVSQSSGQGSVTAADPQRFSRIRGETCRCAAGIGDSGLGIGGSPACRNSLSLSMLAARMDGEGNRRMSNVEGRNVLGGRDGVPVGPTFLSDSLTRAPPERPTGMSAPRRMPTGAFQGMGGRKGVRPLRQSSRPDPFCLPPFVLGHIALWWSALHKIRPDGVSEQ